MKKTILLSILVYTVFGFGSCTYNYPKEVIYQSNFKSLDLRVNANDWMFSDKGG